MNDPARSPSPWRLALLIALTVVLPVGLLAYAGLRSVARDRQLHAEQLAAGYRALASERAAAFDAALRRRIAGWLDRLADVPAGDVDRLRELQAALVDELGYPVQAVIEGRDGELLYPAEPPPAAQEGWPAAAADRLRRRLGDATASTGGSELERLRALAAAEPSLAPLCEQRIGAILAGAGDHAAAAQAFRRASDGGTALPAYFALVTRLEAARAHLAAEAAGSAAARALEVLEACVARPHDLPRPAAASYLAGRAEALLDGVALTDAQRARRSAARALAARRDAEADLRRRLAALRPALDRLAAGAPGPAFAPLADGGVALDRRGARRVGLRVPHALFARLFGELFDDRAGAALGPGAEAGAEAGAGTGAGTGAGAAGEAGMGAGAGAEIGAGISEAELAPVALVRAGEPAYVAAFARASVPLLPEYAVAAAPADRAASERVLRQRITTQLALLGAAVLLAGCGGAFGVRAFLRTRAASRAKSAFIARISHELRTPLALIKGVAETLALGRADADPDRRARYLATLQRESDALSRLVEGVLDFGALDRGELGAPEPVDLAALVDEVCESVRDWAEADGFRVALDADGGPLLLTLDRDAVRLALLNLMANAVKYGGASDERVVEVALRRQGDGARVVVADRGSGLDDDEAARIFEPFVRGVAARPGIRGAGLGLALVREVARRHRGRAVARARPGGGAQFTLQLRDALPEPGGRR